MVSLQEETFHHLFKAPFGRKMAHLFKAHSAGKKAHQFRSGGSCILNGNS